MIDKKLFDLYTKKSKGQGGGDGESRESSGEDISREQEQEPKKFIQLTKDLPNTTRYKITNIRELCSSLCTRENCTNNLHCRWGYNRCTFTLTPSLAIKFVNKITDELLDSELLSKELLQKDNYYVSDIVSNSVFLEHEGQKIIKSSNITINSILSDLFKDQALPKIGRKHFSSLSKNPLTLNEENPLKQYGNYYYQNILPNNISIFRAFSNGYVWSKYKLLDKHNRNLGYYSETQTNLSTFFKSNVIDWLLDKKHENIINSYLNKYIDKLNINNYIKNINIDNTPGLVELFVLCKIYDKQVILYNHDNNIEYVINKDDIHGYRQDLDKLINLIDDIHIKIIQKSNTNIPQFLDILYFL